MHERAGHGWYEAGLPGLAASLIGSTESLGSDQFDSCMWENMVDAAALWDRAGAADRWRGGRRHVRSRRRRAVPRRQPRQAHVHPRRGRRGHLRLHIILRYELEQELVEGTLAVRDLPEAWNAGFEQYLGVPVTNDTEGVLQDVHWSAGLIGYFPTYALGNLIAGQLWSERTSTSVTSRTSWQRRAATAARSRPTARPSPWGRSPPWLSRRGRPAAPMSVTPFTSHPQRSSARSEWTYECRPRRPVDPLER